MWLPSRLSLTWTALTIKIKLWLENPLSGYSWSFHGASWELVSGVGRTSLQQQRGPGQAAVSGEGRGMGSTALQNLGISLVPGVNRLQRGLRPSVRCKKLSGSLLIGDCSSLLTASVNLGTNGASAYGHTPLLTRCLLFGPGAGRVQSPCAL